MIRAFELDGAVVRRPFSVRLDGSSTEQLDGAVHAAGLHCLVECKDRREPLNADAIARLRNQLLRRPAGAVGLMFSRSGYHESAKVLARYSAQQPILLWHKEEIEAVLERENPCAMLQLKYRRCVEEGQPESNLINIEPMKVLIAVYKPSGAPIIRRVLGLCSPDEVYVYGVQERSSVPSAEDVAVSEHNARVICVVDADCNNALTSPAASSQTSGS